MALSFEMSDCIVLSSTEKTTTEFLNFGCVFTNTTVRNFAFPILRNFEKQVLNKQEEYTGK